MDSFKLIACLACVLALSYQASAASCKDGFKSHGYACYKPIHRYKRQWKNAQAYCEEAGGYLAVVNKWDISYIKNELGRYLTSKCSDDAGRIHFWVGGSYCKDRWVMMKGVPDPDKCKSYKAIYSTYWAPGEPNGMNKADPDHCISFYIDKGIWNNDNCGDWKCLLCEHKPF